MENISTMLSLDQAIKLADKVKEWSFIRRNYGVIFQDIKSEYYCSIGDTGINVTILGREKAFKKNNYTIHINSSERVLCRYSCSAEDDPRIKECYERVKEKYEQKKQKKKDRDLKIAKALLGQLELF
jgi:hypothetical protein